MQSSRAWIADDFQDGPMHHFWLVNRGLWNRRESDYLEQMQVALSLLRDSSAYRTARKAFVRCAVFFCNPCPRILLQKQPFLCYVSHFT